MDRESWALLLSLPLLSLGYYFAIHTIWPNFTIFDLYIFAYNPSIGLPLIWFMYPLVTALILIRIWKQRSNSNFIVRAGKRLHIFIAQASDVVVVSILSATIAHLSLLLIGAICIGIPVNVDSSSSLFAYYTGGHTISEFSLSAALPITFAYAFLALFFSNTLFFFLYDILKAIPAFFIMALMAFPEVHKTHAFMHDIASTYGGDPLSVNPLSYLYETANIFYQSWIPGEDHRLWFLPVITVVVLLLAFVSQRRVEYL